MMCHGQLQHVGVGWENWESSNASSIPGLISTNVRETRSVMKIRRRVRLYRRWLCQQTLLTWPMSCSMNAPVMVELSGETDPLEVSITASLSAVECSVEDDFIL